jgi:Family of unknown function (DUF6132)
MKNWMMWGLGIVIGAVSGYLYWYFAGCESGRCAITSSPVNSTLYGSLLGAALANAINSPRNERP